MILLSKPSFAPGTAVIYITVGALLNVWTAIYYFAFAGTFHPDTVHTTMFWLMGFFATGVILMVIGFALGPISRSAEQAAPAAIVDPAPAVQPVIVPAATPQAAVTAPAYVEPVRR